MSTPFGVIPEAAELPKVYIYCAGKWGLLGLYVMLAVAEDGERLAAHLSDHPSFALGDLHNQRPRHAAYIAKFRGYGDGIHYKVIQVPVGEELPEHVAEAIRRKNEEAASKEER